MINLYKMQRVKTTFLSNIKQLYGNNREILETAKVSNNINKHRLYTLIYLANKKLTVFDNVSKKNSSGVLQDVSQHFSVHERDTSPFVANVLLNDSNREIAITKWKGTVETQQRFIDTLYDRCYRVATWRSITANGVDVDFGDNDFIFCHPAVGCWIVPVHFSLKLLTRSITKIADKCFYNLYFKYNNSFKYAGRVETNVADEIPNIQRTSFGDSDIPIDPVVLRVEFFDFYNDQCLNAKYFEETKVSKKNDR